MWPKYAPPAMRPERGGLQHRWTLLIVLCLGVVHSGCGSSGQKLTRAEVVEAMRGLPGHHWLVHSPEPKTMVYGKVKEGRLLTKFIVELDSGDKSATKRYLSNRYSGAWFPYDGGEWGIADIELGPAQPHSHRSFVVELEERLCQRTLGTVCPP